MESTLSPVYFMIYKKICSLKRFRALIEERANENREMTVLLSCVKQQASSTFIRFKRITRENGSICKSTREISGDGGSIRWAPDPPEYLSSFPFLGINLWILPAIELCSSHPPDVCFHLILCCSPVSFPGLSHPGSEVAVPSGRPFYQLPCDHFHLALKIRLCDCFKAAYNWDEV